MDHLEFSTGLIYRTACTFCDAVHEESHMVWFGSALPYPNLPADWRVVDGKPMCSKHALFVKEINEQGFTDERAI